MRRWINESINALLYLAALGLVVFVCACARGDDSLRSRYASFVAASKSAPVQDSPRIAYPDGVYFVSDPTWCLACNQDEPKVRAAKVKLDGQGWSFANAVFGTRGQKANIYFIDRVNPDEPQQIVTDIFGEDFTMPCAVALEGGQVVRHWGASCERPLDQWTFGWLATGIDQRPREKPVAALAHYPLRSGWWSVEGSWRHGRSYVLSHMKQVHGKNFSPQWLDTLSQPELESLHSDCHEGRVHWQFAVRAGQAIPVSQVALPKPTVPVKTQSYCPTCPNYSRRR